MKPGDLAIIRCKREPRFHMKLIFLIERHPPERFGRGAMWTCLLGGREHLIPCGWITRVDQ